MGSEREQTVIDLDQCDWEAIKQAANESKWMPKDLYYQSDWVSDVCAFLRGDHLPTERTDNG